MATSKHRSLILLALSASLLSFQAFAGVVITGTRVIYPSAQKEVTVKMNNDGSRPVLMQAWVDSGNPKTKPSESRAPFVLSPPVARIDPGKGQSLRMMFSGASPLAADKESIFWLNVLEIPPTPENAEDKNLLHMAFRTRIKVFYRPSGLQGAPSQAISQLQWQVVPEGKGYALQAYNPSAYHVSLANAALVLGGQRHAGSEVDMVGPGQTRQFALPSLDARPVSGARVEYSAINDYGAHVQEFKPLEG
ncbi:fimbria/pilus periplasmic chaperone [Pseudomonas putida]|nr:fimbria/pilus periplasmic chaperone [Pseudomonas putida]